MQHIESSIKVNFTKEYSRFRMITGNRQLNAAKIKRIERDIADGLDVLRFCPILVRENEKGLLDIIDGQHRFWVSKSKKTNVWYILCDGMSLVDIARINSNTEKWNSEDFINCYVQQGINDYVQLQEFRDKYGLPLTPCLKLLLYGTIRSEGGTSRSIKQDFQIGLFTIKFHQEAISVAEDIQLFRAFSYAKSAVFIEAICRIRNAGKITVAELHQKVMKHSDQLGRRSTAKDYLINLENVFNIGRQGRKTIY